MKKFYLIFWLFFNLNIVFAAQDNSQPQKTCDDDNKKFFISGSVFGLSPIMQAGGTVGFSVMENLNIIAQYHENAFVLSDSSFKTYFIGMQKYWNSNFYTNILAGYGVFQRGKKVDSLNLPITDTPVSIRGQSWLVGIAVGNTWSFAKGFSFGIDWITYGFAVAQKQQWSADSNANADPVKFRQLESDIADERPANSVRIGTLYLGWGF